MRGAAIVEVPDQLGTVVPDHRHVPSIVERALYQLGQARPGRRSLRHSRPVIIASADSVSDRGEAKVARTALGSNPQCTMQSWQRGFPLLCPYFDHSVSSISSRKVLA